MKKVVSSISGILISASYAFAIPIGAPSAGPFAKIGAFFQYIVDFAGGAGSLFVIVLSIAGALGLWVMMPKQSGVAIGWIFRACIGAIVLFGIGTMITWLQSL